MTALIPSIRHAVCSGKSFDIGYDKTGKKSVQTLSLGDSILHLKDDAYHTERVHRTVKVLTQALKEMPRLPIPEAMQHPSVNTARKYLRSISPGYFEDPKVKECCRQLLAAKLGIQREVFNSNPGFEDFAFKSHIDRYLLHYGHSLEILPSTNELHLLCGGKYVSWNDARKMLEKMPSPNANFPGNPQLSWRYGQDGLQKEDMYAWTELKPYKVVKDHDWGNRYIFEYCVCCGKNVQMNGDHAWLRLKTPDGEIYCTGLYRPGKKHLFDNFHFPMRAKKGYLMSPDVSEFWPTPIYRIPVEITKAQFEKIKSSIEEDKKNEENLVFQLFNGNCTEYVNSKAAIAGIHLPTSQHYLRNVIPLSLQRKFDPLFKKLPGIIQKIATLAVTALSNLVLLCLGTHLLDDSLKKKKVSFTPHISTFADIFNPEKLKFHPPRHLGLDIRKDIQEWRNSEKEKLLNNSQGDQGDIKKAIEDLDYKLPEKYYCSN